MSEQETSPANSPRLEPGLLVSDVMERWPQTAAVFLKHRMNCVGCEMSVFEAISDAARIYGIPGEQFIQELQQAVLAAMGDSGSAPGPETSHA